MLGPILPVLSRTWSLSDAEAGVFLACEFLGGFCGALASGWLGGRRSPMTLLTAGLVLLTLGFAGAALMLKLWLPIFLFVCGLGLGFINPMANVIVSRSGFPSPAAAVNLFGFSWAAGALAAPAVIARLMVHQSPAGVFLDLELLATAVACFAAIIRISIGTTDAARKVPKADAGNGHFIAITGTLLFLYVGVETSVSVWLPTAAARWAAMTESEAAAAQSSFLGAILLGRLLAPAWLRHFKPHALILAGLSVGAAGIGTLMATSSYWSLMAGAVIAGIGLAPVNPTIVAVFTTRMGSNAARWTGPVFAAAGLGGAAIP